MKYLLYLTEKFFKIAYNYSSANTTENDLAYEIEKKIKINISNSNVN